MKKQNSKRLLTLKKQAISNLNKGNINGGSVTVTSFPNTACRICKRH